MILSDREIRAALVRGAIRITPEPRDDDRAWSSTAIDLRLDAQLARWQFPSQGLRFQFTPGDAEYDLDKLMDNYLVHISIPENGHPVEPGQFWLGWTLEKLQLPHRSRLAARVEGKSNLARLGLGVHVTAPTIHAGFGHNVRNPAFRGNPIQLEIWNVGPLPVALKMGMKICQLIFEEVHGTPEQGYSGQFAIQGPKV